MENIKIGSNNQKEKIRAMVENLYDMQKMRISCGNRLVASFLDLGDKSRSRTADSVRAENAEKEADKERDKAIKKILQEYIRITDFFANEATSRRVTDSRVEKAIAEANKSNKLELIGTVYEYRLAETYNSLLKTEEQAIIALASEVKRHPMWTEFFDEVLGCGPMMAAVCLSYFDVHKARHPSSFWKYAGLDVVNGEGRSRKHTEVRDYIDPSGNIKTKNGITFNPKLKTKLVGVLGPCIIKCSREKKSADSEESGRPIGYAKIYYDYKNRLDNKVDYFEQIFNLVEKAEAIGELDSKKLLKAVSEIWQVNRHSDVVEISVVNTGAKYIQLTTDAGDKVNVYNKLYTPGHKHNMAMRYMIKQFVRDLWIKWRTLEGYDIGEPYYEVAKLGYKPHG